MSYTDASPPTAYSGDLRRGIAAETGAVLPKVQYALYTDSSTWSSWTDWAKQNALDYDNTKDYSSRAIQIVGNWPTISGDYTNDASELIRYYPVMCIQDKASSNAKGTICVEGNRDESDVYTTITYLLTKDQTTKHLDALSEAGSGFWSDVNWSQVKLDLVGTYGAVAISEVTTTSDVASTPYQFLSFEVMNCSLNSIQMNCINWVASSDYDAELTDNQVYNRWGDGSPAKFFWFDPEAVLTAELVNTPSTGEGSITTKWATGEVTMVLETSSAVNLYYGIASLIVASAALTF